MLDDIRAAITYASDLLSEEDKRKLLLVSACLVCLFAVWKAGKQGATAVRWTAGLFRGKGGEVCVAACRLLDGTDTQTDQKKLGIDGAGQEKFETTVKAGLLVVTLETADIQLHGSDLSAKLHRREKRRILRCAARRRREILARELETARAEAAELMARKPAPAVQPAYHGDRGINVSPNMRKLMEENGKPCGV